jgi:5-methylcytosine-specific restriction endonuclease McrA
MKGSDVFVRPELERFCMECGQKRWFEGSWSNEVKALMVYECSVCGHLVGLDYDIDDKFLEENFYDFIVENGPHSIEDITGDGEVSHGELIGVVKSSERLFFDDSGRVVAGQSEQNNGEQA